MVKNSSIRMAKRGLVLYIHDKFVVLPVNNIVICKEVAVSA